MAGFFDALYGQSIISTENREKQGVKTGQNRPSLLSNKGVSERIIP